MIVDRGHLSVLEHISLSVRFVTDRGISHELVRHRLASYSQESTRFCSYAKDQFGHEITVVKPSGIEPDMAVFTAYEIWEAACAHAERSYFGLLERGIKPEIARSVLPQCLATTIVMTANLREWLLVLSQRCAPAAHPDMRLLMKPVLRVFCDALPEVFGDLAPLCKDRQNAAVP